MGAISGVQNYTIVSYDILALVNLYLQEIKALLVPTLIVGFELGPFQFKKVLSGYALLKVFVRSGKRLA